MENSTILTAEGAQKLEEQLEYLKTVARKEIAQQIKVAREFGDLSENAEYDEAKNEQARIEGEIVELEKKLRGATIIDESTLDRSVVHIGAAVDLKDQAGKKFQFTIVGSTEADPLKGRISNESPVGAALLGHHKGDRVEVTTPAGVQTYTILAIN
ncbi:transcription elongation factor GreA [Christensenella sp. MSJ-20]|uniref:transcription elongation factor GreA n=1 Tax=Christensenella sp. MSJ-20 TaxID=2841518 RepID=UPI001C78A890|nr:transcription elongation factor GreA [Christensenella sp. MSJ-20]